jgi:hypothetical protein
MSIRVDSTIPDTGKRIDRSQVDAEVAHEESLWYFLQNTELGVLDKEQMGVIALVDAYEELDLMLPASKRFFERLRRLSSGEEGRGRVQAKEVITAGSFPMSLLFGQQQTGGIIEGIKSLWPGRKSEPAPQPGAR